MRAPAKFRVDLTTRAHFLSLADAPATGKRIILRPSPLYAHCQSEMIEKRRYSTRHLVGRLGPGSRVARTWNVT
jgi:hypothetical protein